MKDTAVCYDPPTDGVRLEAKEVATTILLLESPEPDILAASCRALYRHVEKNDENKLSLFNQNAIEKLIPLIQHADARVRSFSMMTLAALSKHPEIRKFLRKDKITLAKIVALLTMDYDLPAILESAAIYLASLSLDFGTKVFLCEFDALVPLVRCLGYSDPDVQMNAMQAIASLMQDFTCRAAMLEIEGGFKAIINILTCSEFPISQYYALNALQEASKDFDVRSELCDIRIIETLVEYISKPETEALHVYALQVLANCCESQKSYKPLRESGGLLMLVSFTDPNRKIPTNSTNTTLAPSGLSHDDEAGKKSKKEMKVSTTAGSVKGSTLNKIEEPIKDVTQPQVIAPPPDVLSPVALTIAYAAKSGQNALVLHEKGVEEKLVQLLNYPDRPEVQTSAAYALASLAVSRSCRKSILNADGLAALILLLKINRVDTVEAALLALANLTVENPEINEQISNLGLPAILVQLLQNTVGVTHDSVAEETHQREQTKSDKQADKQADKQRDKEKERGTSVTVLNEAGLINAVHIISALSVDVGLRQDLLRHVVVGRLVEVLQSSRAFGLLIDRHPEKSLMIDCKSAHLHGIITYTLSSLCIDVEARNQIISSHGGLEILVQLLCSLDLTVIKYSSWVLSNLSNDPSIALEIYSLGALPIVQGIINSPSRCNSFTRRLLERLIDCNLPEKYAHLGVLSTENILYDGFYDPGQLKENVQLKTLEQYASEDYNCDRRAVLLINPKPLQPSTSHSIIAPSESQSEAKVGGNKRVSGSGEGRSSRGSTGSTTAGRDSRKKANSLKSDSKQKLSEDLVPASESSETLIVPSLPEEVKEYQPQGDAELWQYLEFCGSHLNAARSSSTNVEWIAFLACFVQEKMGGLLNDMLKTSWFGHIQELKRYTLSHVIPIGYIKCGVQCHRALLFKSLADRLGVECSLVRGDYNRAWNEVTLTYNDINDLQLLQDRLAECRYTCESILTQPVAFSTIELTSDSADRQDLTKDPGEIKNESKDSQDSLHKEESAEESENNSNSNRTKQAGRQGGKETNANANAPAVTTKKNLAAKQEIKKEKEVISEPQPHLPSVASKIFERNKENSSPPVKYIINLTDADSICKVFMRCGSEEAEKYKQQEQTLYSCHKPTCLH